MNTAAVVWASKPGQRLHWRDWGGDSVVFDERSGLTHQLSPLAAAAMAWLEERSLSRDALLAALAADLGAEPDAALGQALDAALDQFIERDWIEALTPTSPR